MPSSRHFQKALAVILAVLYVITPPILVRLFFPTSPYLTGTHAWLSELGSMCLLAYLTFQNPTECRDTGLLALTFLTAFVADIIYMFTVNLTNSGDLWIVKVSEASYTVFVTLLLTFLWKKTRHLLRDRTSMAIMTGTFFLLAYGNLRYVLWPFYFREQTPVLFHLVNTTAYALVMTLLTVIIVPLALRVRGAYEHLFIQLLVFLAVGDFGIRAQPSDSGLVVLVGFEYAWEMAMAGWFMLFLFHRRAPFWRGAALAKYPSLRTMLSVGIWIGLFAFAMLLQMFGFARLSNAYNLTNVLLIAVAVWFLASSMALIASENIMGVNIDLLKNAIPGPETLSIDQLAGFRFSAIQRSPRFEETEAIVSEYNALAARANRLIDLGAEASRYAAIARTTQMMAHDVRKPFSTLKLGLRLLANAEDERQMRDLVHRLVPEVERSMTSVNGMLHDIMEIGANKPPSSEPTSVESLIEASLLDVMRIHPQAEVTITYELRHAHMLTVEGPKVLRVFSNIIDNAFQAMKVRGAIWVSTREILDQERPMVEIGIGNSGSFIPADELGPIFEAFFTKGKPGGTGLGLAIARKIVSAHGGRIWCTSDVAAGTEFWFTLPLLEDRATETSARLPSSSAEGRERLAFGLRRWNSSTTPEKGGDDLGEENAKKELLTKWQHRTTKCKVLIVDDEALYLAALRSQIEKDADVLAVVEFLSAKSAADVHHFKPTEIDAVICDIDLGSGADDGFEVIRWLRREGCPARIIVHSNRTSAADLQAAVDAGADGFLPKPMTRVHLLRILASINS